MEVRSRLSDGWIRAKALALTVKRAVLNFLGEVVFRVVLAGRVVLGLTPIEAKKRPWAKSVDTPVLVDVFDWTNDRLVFSILVWPPLETPKADAVYDHYQRVEGVLDAIAKGAKEKMWCTRWEVDYSLRWDPKRRCWVDSSGHSYDGDREIFIYGA